MDGDGQHRPEDIAKLLADAEHYHMVVGARAKGSRLRFHRYAANIFYNLLASYVTKFKVKDLTSGFRVLSRVDALRFIDLLPNTFSYPTTLTLAFLRSGLTVKYVPIQSLYRAGQSKISDPWITLIVKPDVYNLVELCPYVNEILTYEWGASLPFRPFRRHWRALKLAATRLWQRQFELAILPRWDTDHFHGAFLLYLSGALKRVGYSEKASSTKSWLNRGFDRFLTHSLDGGHQKHEVERNLDVIRFLGGEVKDNSLELWVNEADEIFAKETLRRFGVKETDLVVGMGPGAGVAKRRWPIERYQEVGSWIVHRLTGKLIIVGGPGEESLGEVFCRALGLSAINLAGKTTLRQTAAVLKRTSLYIGNDAGPMHIAAAAGVPIAEISCHPRHGSKSVRIVHRDLGRGVSGALSFSRPSRCRAVRRNVLPIAPIAFWMCPLTRWSGRLRVSLTKIRSA